MRHCSIFLLVLLLAAIAVGQDAELSGKVYLQGGQTYEGIIEVAEFGVVDGAGIGTERSPTNDYLSVQVDGEQVRVPVSDIAIVEADWQKTGVEGAEKWQVQSLTITRKDGTKVSGRLHWLLHETPVRVRAADGTIARAHAFPVASADFDPANLLVKIELGAAVSAGGTATEPTPTTPEPTGPTTAPPGESGTAGSETPAKPSDTTLPAEGAAVKPTLPAGEASAALGVPATLTLTVVCPKCGEKIVVEVTVNAKTGG
ncbi:MAG: hypothetical protein ACUVX8_06275 [Candidatus Zipacnadales bacterium]